MIRYESLTSKALMYCSMVLFIAQDVFQTSALQKLARGGIGGVMAEV